MKRLLKKRIFWMGVMTTAYIFLCMKLEYDLKNEQPSAKFEAIIDTMYRGETESVRILTTDGIDVTDVVLEHCRKAYLKKDYDVIYESFKDRYVICYDPLHADLNP